jgi:hypothetical protein
MRWREAHQQAMIAAANAHVDGGLDALNRIDVFRAMHDAGLKVMFKPLTGSAALYLPPLYGARPGAILNANHPLALQRYSAAHEYGHHVFGHREPQVVRNPEPRLADGRLAPEEKLAEAFAAWFLMPPEAVDTALERLRTDHPQEPKDAYQLALRLGVSYLAICVHLPSVKRLDRTTASAWARVAPKSIKQELTATPPPGGWRADVWEIGESDAAAPLVVRPGDRLIIGIPGVEGLEDAPVGAAAATEPAPDLLGASRLRIDLASDMPAGRSRLVSSGLAVDLLVERPRRGLYLPETGT